MDTIPIDVASGQPEGVQQQFDELRRQNARMARSIRRQRWAFVAAGIVSLAVAAGFRTARAQPGPPPGIPVGLPTHLTQIGRYLIGVHNIRYAYRSQNIGTVYFTGSDKALTLNPDETAQLYATVVR